MHQRGPLGRLVAVLSAAVLGLSLTACGSTASSSAPPANSPNPTSGTSAAPSSSAELNANLVMTIWGSTNDTDTYQQRADLYTAKHPGVKVQVRNIPVENYDQQVETMIAGGSSPDIILVDSTRSPGFASRGQTLDLTPFIQRDGLKLEDNVDAGRVTGYQLNGKQFAVPDRGGNIVFYYNKTMFAAAGVPEPKAGWTWAEMVDAAKKLTITKDGKIEQYGVAIDNWPNAVDSVMMSFGAKMFTDDLSGPAIDSAAYKQGLQQYADLALKLKVSPTLQDYADFGQNVNRDGLFAQGKTAMIWAGVWDVPDFVKQNLQFGIVPPPQVDDTNPTMLAFGTGIAIGSRSTQQDAAWEVVKFMFTPEGQQPIVDNHQDVPSAKSLISAWQANLPGGVTYDEVSKAGDKVFSPAVPPQIAQISHQVEQDLYPFFTGTTSVDDATSLAAQHIRELLAGG